MGWHVYDPEENPNPPLGLVWSKLLGVENRCFRWCIDEFYCCYLNWFISLEFVLFHLIEVLSHWYILLEWMHIFVSLELSTYCWIGALLEWTILHWTKNLLLCWSIVSMTFLETRIYCCVSFFEDQYIFLHFNFWRLH